VNAGGFKTFKRDNLNLASGDTLRADAMLSLGNIWLRSLTIAQGTPKPQPQSDLASQMPTKVGGNVRPATVIRRVDPVYPADLQAQGIEGTVLMAAVISKEGATLWLNPLNNGANAEFVIAAEQALRQWRFEPTLLNGEPIEVLTTLEVEFKLRQ
jgi:TonB family protein